MRAGGYNALVTISRRLDIPRRTLAAQFASIIRDARQAMGWTQDELATRAGTSQTRIWRLERGDSSSFDPGVIDNVLEALGVRVSLTASARHLDDRVLQRDAVHASLNEAIARRLERLAWQVLTEVGVGGDPPRGWVDLLAYRDADGAMAIGEMKTLITDAGNLQRQVAYYEREAHWAARRAGWRPRTVVPFVVALDTRAVADALRDNARLLRRSFPGEPAELARWLEVPGSPPPRGPTLVVTDLASRRTHALRPSALHVRVRKTAYIDYADAASSLRRRRR